MIDIKDIITLSDDNEYIVVSKVDYEGKTYYYLVDLNNNANIKFVYIKNDEVIELNDKEFVTTLLPLLLNASTEKNNN